MLLASGGCAPKRAHQTRPSAAGVRAFNTTQPAQLRGLDGWRVEPVFTVGESVGDYRPVGVLDGIGAMALDRDVVRVFVNHELHGDRGYAYRLGNGTTLTGARVSYFDITRADRRLVGAGLAYDTIVDRAGRVVTSAPQINEGASATEGLDALCSSFLFETGHYGLHDTVYFTGEESPGGQAFALEVATRTLHCVPQLGRAEFENVALLESGDPGTVALLIGDDRPGAPLSLYVGTRNALRDGGFLDRNGLARGTLYAWKSSTGERSEQEFHGTGAAREGPFVAVAQFDASRAGQPGYDALGYADQATLDAERKTSGAFAFARPEDLATNPANGHEVLFISTGRGSIYPADTWGAVYRVDVTLGAAPRATVTILYSGDDAGAGRFSGPDYGPRNPDNIDWADDGFAYVCEDRATEPPSLFGAASHLEASMWRIAPATGAATRIAMIDRAAVPAGQTDPAPGEIGKWETSGVMDVTSLFETRPGDVLLIADVQAHGVTCASMTAGDPGDLVEGGQLLFLSSPPSP